MFVTPFEFYCPGSKTTVYPRTSRGSCGLSGQASLVRTGKDRRVCREEGVLQKSDPQNNL